MEAIGKLSESLMSVRFRHSPAPQERQKAWQDILDLGDSYSARVTEIGGPVWVRLNGRILSPTVTNGLVRLPKCL